MEAREKLFHLDGGKSLLDFGCGAAELLVYYSLKYDKLVGADFSESMLIEADKRIKQKNCKNIDLVLANHETLWGKLGCTFDRITSAGVMQYLTFEEIDEFILNASKHLNKDGKIVFFDIMDPRLYPLWKMGVFSEDAGLKRILCKIAFETKKAIVATLNNRPRDILGACHNPFTLKKIAKKHGFEIICVQSMYYEYRYHAILLRV